VDPSHPRPCETLPRCCLEGRKHLFFLLIGTGYRRIVDFLVYRVLTGPHRDYGDV